MSDSDGVFVGKHCLVLDDEFLIALDIQEILETAGAASVICVSTAAEALEALNREPKFDVAVLDVKLESAAGNSITVATALSARKTPFVFLTGMRAAEVSAQSFPSAPVVEKPYEAAALLTALRQVLSE